MTMTTATFVVPPVYEQAFASIPCAAVVKITDRWVHVVDLAGKSIAKRRYKLSHQVSTMSFLQLVDFVKAG